MEVEVVGWVWLGVFGFLRKLVSVEALRFVGHTLEWYGYG